MFFAGAFHLCVPLSSRFEICLSVARGVTSLEEECDIGRSMLAFLVAGSGVQILSRRPAPRYVIYYLARASTGVSGITSALQLTGGQMVRIHPETHGAPGIGSIGPTPNALLRLAAL
jgi:hypothetical protein